MMCESTLLTLFFIILIYFALVLDKLTSRKRVVKRSSLVLCLFYRCLDLKDAYGFVYC